MPDALTTDAPAPAVSAQARRATPEMIAAAWRAFRGNRPGSLLGPGPGFAEAIGAAMALDPRVAELETALAFYADTKSYAPTGWQGDMDPAPAMSDHGRRARAALDAARRGRTTEGEGCEL